jgi:hypothetical protein
MNEGAPAVEIHVMKNQLYNPWIGEVARIQLSWVGTPNTHIKRNATLPAVMVVQQLMTD